MQHNLVIGDAISESWLIRSLAVEHRKRLVISLFWLLASSAASLILPWLVGSLVASVQDLKGVASGGVSLVLPVLGALVLQAAISYVSGLSLSMTAEHVMTSIRCRVFNKIQRLPTSWFDHRSHGANISLLTNDSSVLGNFLSGTLIATVPQFVTLIGAVVLIAWINFSLVFWVLGSVAICLILAKVLGRRVRELSQYLLSKYDILVESFDQNLRHVELIKSVAAEKSQATVFRDKNDAYVDAVKGFYLHQQSISPAIQLIGGIIALSGFTFMYSKIVQGEMPIADIVRVLLYGFLVVRPLSRLAGVYGLYQKARMAHDRLMVALNATEESYEKGAFISGFKSGPSLAFESVSFQYPGRIPLFDSLSFEIKAGNCFAFIGENGSGKSTIAKLLMRFITPESGSIAIDGVDVQDFDLESYRNSLGYVSQSTQLLNTSIRDNLRLGYDLLGDEESSKVLDIVRMREFVSSLENGLDEVVGEEGIMLSGGQKQRLCLARALLRSPQLLILDEATSMFDLDSEQIVVKGIREFLPAATIVMITHRRGALQIADTVMQVKDGRLIQVES